MRPTKRFSGDLLLGGARLRDIECELHEVPNQDEDLWTGRFRIDPCQGTLFELGRPYLLQLADGRASRIQVSSVSADRLASALVVEFQSVR